MALVLSSDLSDAGWLVTSEVPWERLVTFGPPGFQAYARLRFLPDPSYEGQRELDADSGSARCAVDQWLALFELLAAHTRTPDECYFCLWDGWPFAQTAHHPTLNVPPDREVPFRRYFLFRGSLSDAGDWGPDFASGGPASYEPAFLWPADHAWCIANDVDPHWAGIGADVIVIERLVTDPRLDAVRADPVDVQPAYR